jgi:hypothetical protein
MRMRGLYIMADSTARAGPLPRELALHPTRLCNCGFAAFK